MPPTDAQGASDRQPRTLGRADRAFALDWAATLRVEQLIDELKERYMIVIVTDNLQQATPATNATEFVRDGELVERGPRTGMLTDPKDECTDRDVSGKLG